MNIYVLVRTEGDGYTYSCDQYSFIQYESKAKLEEDFLDVVKEAIRQDIISKNYIPFHFCGYSYYWGELVWDDKKRQYLHKHPDMIDALLFSDLDFHFFGTIYEFLESNGFEQHQAFNQHPIEGIGFNEGKCE